jgi:hypothetical protein
LIINRLFASRPQLELTVSDLLVMGMPLEEWIYLARGHHLPALIYSFFGGKKTSSFFFPPPP